MWCNVIPALVFLTLLCMTALGEAPPCSIGSDAIKNRQFLDAQPALWQCVLSDERQPQDAVNLTLTYRALKNYEDGQTKARAALEQSPTNEDLHYFLAYIYFRLQKFTLSTEELRDAYLLNRSDWRIHQLFALNFIEQKSLANAEQELLRAIRLSPGNGELYYQLARLYYTQQRFAESKDASKRAITYAPDYAQAYDNLGLCYEAEQDLPNAIASFSHAINLTAKFGSSDAWPYIDYATLLEENSPKSAIDLLKQAVVVDASNAEIYYQLGRSFRRVGLPSEARANFEKAIALDPKSASSYYALAILLRSIDPIRSEEMMHTFRNLQQP